TDRAPAPVVWTFSSDRNRVARFGRDSVKTTLFIGKWLTLAFVLKSPMVAFIPAEWISQALGGEGLLAIATATFVGVPAYLNGYAALPLVSSLIGQGMLRGAGLAFLVASGVTSIPAAISVFALVKRQVFALYVSFVLIGSGA
ncbi:MAG: permease, partial [Alphaproteobacteria bacterium]